MTTGREVYERARRRALARTPADPQHTRNLTDPRVAAAALNAPCATPVPGGVCGDANLLHHITRGGRVTWCTVMTGAGRCGCTMFTAVSNPVEGEPDG